MATKGKKTDESATADSSSADVLDLFHPVTARWFRAVFEDLTPPQREGWPAIARGESTLILAPTGTGKTLTAFLWCLDRLMLRDSPRTEGCRILYISPLKALAVDVERNLRSPLTGISNMAQAAGVPVHTPEISIRTGDTPARDRARFRRHPGEILITTPESLYLLLTSDAAETLRTVDTVIIDEIHALVPTKRGAHLALSLERLQALCARPLQRIGLSATQRPLEEVARYLGGADGQGLEKQKKQPSLQAQAGDTQAVVEAFTDALETEDNVDAREATGPRFRPVTIVNAGARKTLELRVEVPVEDMAKLGQMEEIPSGPASQGPKRASIWQSIHPRLLEIVRSRTSTLIFVNARRIAERLAGALNELSGEPIARAHHGSLSAAQRSEIEEALKAGRLKALVCTSSLELGIDMGAIDLVVQIEAPPSVAAGMQRIGRAGHSVGAASSGIIFPKYRADLIACVAVTQAMHQGHVESTRFLRNPLDVLAQQIVATIAQPPLSPAETERQRKSRTSPDFAGPGISVDDLLTIVRSAAPFANLSVPIFDGLLDMLAGRYPSDEFAELRPRITWDRTRNWLTPREGVKRIAILNGGTIPDRGLYGVFLSGSEKPVRVGELDEEMVFEARTGETFVLGASTWRIDEITNDRVLVSPAPGEPGKMPFWHGDQAGRPIEFGRRIGTLVRELRELPRSVAMTQLTRDHDLDAQAAENVLRYLADQELATGQVPDDRTIVVERVRDELGDWRICCLTPFGSKVHTPWAMAASARIRAAGLDVETMWTEDGFVLRFPDTENPPDIDFLLLEPEEAANLVMRQLGSTALFAAKFREASSRALLLPRRRAEGRTPLWQQRKRAYDLLAVASRYPSFPMLLEAYRECLRDVFDMPALIETLRAVQNRSIRVHVTDSRSPSPFAGALLFGYVANYIYDGDAPLAERRAQALSIDQDQLRELLGDADLRELLDTGAIEETEEQLQSLVEEYKARSMDAVHDLLLRIGDLTREELAARSMTPEVAASADRLLRSRRALEVMIAGQKRLIAVEDAARVRDALGVPLPPGLPSAFVEPTNDAVLDLVRRFGRTRGPFTTSDVAARYALPRLVIESALQRLVTMGRVVEGGFRPGGLVREWIDAEVLRSVRRKSLAKLRKEIEPVEQRILARLFTRWQGVVQPRRGLDALLDAIENLQGAPFPASLLETEILPARILGYRSSDLDTLIAAGELVWAGLESLGERDGRIGLYLADRLPVLWPPNRIYQPAAKDLTAETQPSERERRIVDYLQRNGASFFQPIHDDTGAGYPGETIEALWSLVWRGLLRNDTLHALRAYCEKPATTHRQARRVHNQPSFRSRRTTPPSAQGRWALNEVAFDTTRTAAPAVTEWSHAIAQQLLNRYGVVFRETAHAENLPGGFSAIYDVLRGLEESGRIRRGYFAADLGATQFAMPAAVDLLRSLRAEVPNDRHEVVMLAATDPANPYGAELRWPDAPEEGSSLTRSTGARVVLIDGALTAYMRRSNPGIQLLLPDDEPLRSQYARALAEFFVASVQKDRSESGHERSGLVIASVNGVSAAEHPLSRFLLDAGFHPAPTGFTVRRGLPPPPATEAPAEAGNHA
ncbi:MAG TPA: DEAD/DEAH box helicase [Acidobacteriaceae bacterium]|nr:DEAD/DEAH box helicase [Acidobacteriaceae bacterium]